MSNEELNRFLMRKDDEYDMLKDTVHEQSDKIRELRTIIYNVREYVKNSQFYYIDNNKSVETVMNTKIKKELLDMLEEK